MYLEKLKSIGIWVIWKLEPDKDGRLTKVPYSPKYNYKCGTNKDYVDKWTTYEEAKEAKVKYHADGVGFVLPLGVFFLDIDHANLETDERVLTMMERFSSYAEISHSGEGLHIYGICNMKEIPGIIKDEFGDFVRDEKGMIAFDRENFYMKNPNNGMELYFGGITNRFAGFTGDTVNDLDLNDCTEALIETLENEMRKKNSTKTKKSASLDCQPPPPGDVATIVSDLRRFKNGDNFSRLYDGDRSGYVSQSEADLALCRLIAFRTGDDPLLIDEVFRSSGLYRGKWDRKDYSGATIRKAIDGCNGEFYSTKMFSELLPQSAENQIECEEFIEVIDDGLPKIEKLSNVIDKSEPLAPVLIEDVLRVSHKMMVSGPSKAGKSFLLIELCWAIASGQTWIGLKCTQGRVLYVNMELDAASCKQRFVEIADKLHYNINDCENIDIWNLRGMTEPIEKLAPKLISRAKDRRYVAIILDPIYKLQMGDENAAGDIGKFCNKIDKICSETGASVIYCHHHSKGDQSYKRAADRASGSGVFARDADALLDLIELDVSGVDINTKNISYTRTAWRVETTLREFPPMKRINLFFDHPIHIVDCDDELNEVKVLSGGKTTAEKKEAQRQKDLYNIALIEEIYEKRYVENVGVHIGEIATQVGKDERTIRRWCKNSDRFEIAKGYIIRKGDLDYRSDKK